MGNFNFGEIALFTAADFETVRLLRGKMPSLTKTGPYGNFILNFEESMRIIGSGRGDMMQFTMLRAATDALLESITVHPEASNEVKKLASTFLDIRRLAMSVA